MELSEKIQRLRKERGLTQEQFAEKIFVSRTAVSKWETGRGTPSMASLQMIASLFEVTLDELLSGEEIARLAKRENEENLFGFAVFCDALCNFAALLGLFLPLYKLEAEGVFYAVPLYMLSGWLSVLYWGFPIVLALCGGLEMILCKSDGAGWKRGLALASRILHAAFVLLLILGGQPYPASLFFALLLLKGAVLLKNRP